MKTCAIITGGKKSSLDNISKSDFIIACDKGYEYCKEESITPNLIIGDFDSINVDLPKDIEIITLQVRKDDTDTMYAIRYCIDHDFERINLYCALGNRLDHTYANIQSCVYAAKHNIDCYVYDKDNYLIISNKNKLIINKYLSNNISIFAVDEIEGLSISGSDYDCENITLINSYPLGQSNHFIKDQITITKRKGIILVICSLENK